MIIEGFLPWIHAACSCCACARLATRMQAATGPVRLSSVSAGYQSGCRAFKRANLCDDAAKVEESKSAAAGCLLVRCPCVERPVNSTARQRSPQCALRVSVYLVHRGKNGEEASQ